MYVTLFGAVFFASLLQVEAQSVTPAETPREQNLHVIPESEDVYLPEDADILRVKEQNKDISAVMGNQYELPDSLYDLMRFQPEDDDDPTVAIKIDQFGRGFIYYRMYSGGWAVDTDFNIRGLLGKMIQAVDDPKRPYILIREFPIEVDGDVMRNMPYVGTDRMLDLLYVGDPRFFAHGRPTPKRLLPSATVHMVIIVPEAQAKRIRKEYDEATEEAERSYLHPDGKKHLDPDKEYTKKMIEDLLPAGDPV